MGRIAALEPDQLSPEQKRIHHEIAGARGGVVRGPFAVWLRLPSIADAANQLGNSIRLHGKLDRRLFELAILIVARHWNAQYEWYVHERDARSAGIAEELIADIRERRVPAFAKEDEKLVYELVTELQDSKTLKDKTYERAVALLGVDLLIELVTTIGFYTTAAMMINVFDVPVPDGSRPLN
jgi:4-carboxymuconolactone decarboxylase